MVNHHKVLPNISNAFDDERYRFNSIINTIANEYYTNSKASKDNIDALTLESTKALTKALNDSYDLSTLSIDIDDVLLKNLKKNIFIFSHIKTYNQLRVVNDLLYVGKDKRRFNDFKNEVLKVNELFNVNYLRAEYNYANATGAEVKKWNNFTSTNPDQLLEYSTVGDQRVRQSHAALDGIVKPASNKLWKDYLPPLGYNCRCTTLRKLDDVDVTDDDVIEQRINNLDEPIDDSFKFNAATENQIFFIKKHNYWKSISNKDKSRIEEEAVELFENN